jgi:hypothetical protein
MPSWGDLGGGGGGGGSRTARGAEQEKALTGSLAAVVLLGCSSWRAIRARDVCMLAMSRRAQKAWRDFSQVDDARWIPRRREGTCPDATYD